MALLSTRTSAVQHNSFTMPSVLAYSAAVLLALASASTNIIAATSKHTEIGPKLIAGSIALSVALLVLVTMPAALSAFRAKQYVTSAIAGVLFVLAGAYSVTSALGVLGAPRLTATMNADHIAKDRARIAEERARHWAELTMLAPSKSMHELSPEIARILALPGLGGCALINGPVTRQWCPTLASLQAEHARAERRSALEGTIARLDTEAARLGTPKLANADAAALVAIAAAFGLSFGVDAVNMALMLLAVCILECASGPALMIAQSMRTVAPSVPVMRDITPNAPTLAAQSVAVIPAACVHAIVEASPAPSATVTAAADKIVMLVRNAGGELRVASKRELGRLAECSHPTASRALATLAGVAVVSQEAGEIIVRLAA